MRIDLQPAYVLHSRQYRDSSLLVDFLTPDFGRICGVVKGVRSSGKSAKQRRGLLQPFNPLLISWIGKADLKTVVASEINGVPVSLTGQDMFSAMYVNELLIRLLQHHDDSTTIFSLYEWVLNRLCSKEYIDIVLRQFEMQLLELLGYGIDLTVDMHDEQRLQPDNEYFFDTESGFTTHYNNCVDTRQLFLGADLIALSQGQFTESVRKTAKRLCRMALAIHLGAKPLKSRELFR